MKNEYKDIAPGDLEGPSEETSKEIDSLNEQSKVILDRHYIKIALEDFDY